MNYNQILSCLSPSASSCFSSTISLNKYHDDQILSKTHIFFITTWTLQPGALSIELSFWTSNMIIKNNNSSFKSQIRYLQSQLQTCFTFSASWTPPLPQTGLLCMANISLKTMQPTLLPSCSIQPSQPDISTEYFISKCENTVDLDWLRIIAIFSTNILHIRSIKQIKLTTALPQSLHSQGC